MIPKQHTTVSDGYSVLKCFNKINSKMFWHILFRSRFLTLCRDQNKDATKLNRHTFATGIYFWLDKCSFDRDLVILGLMPLAFSATCLSWVTPTRAENPMNTHPSPCNPPRSATAPRRRVIMPTMCGCTHARTDVRTDGRTNCRLTVC